MTRPSQIFAIGLNYRAHAAESGVAVPGPPAVFTKFADQHHRSLRRGGAAQRKVDWEVELVVVIGDRADEVPRGRRPGATWPG